MKIILTESQLNNLIFEEQFNSFCGLLEGEEKDNAKKIARGLFGEKTPAVIFKTLAKHLNKKNITIMAVPAILAAILGGNVENSDTKDEIFQGLEQVWEKVKSGDEKVYDAMRGDAEMLKNKLGRWKTVSDDAIATVYNAVPKQCNNDVVHTASMFKLNLGDVLSQRVIAMERTYMAELGLKYGDVVYVEGTGKWDGAWQIQDTMNKRFAGIHKIDILVPNNIKTGKWNGVKISVPADEETAKKAKATMRGSM